MRLPPNLREVAIEGRLKAIADPLDVVDVVNDPSPKG